MGLNIFAVALGGALGALLRYTTLSLLPLGVGTLLVNSLGGLLIGLLSTTLPAESLWGRFLITGGLGALTTFSTFTADSVHLQENNGLATSLLYVGASIGLALGLFFVGRKLGGIFV